MDEGVIFKGDNQNESPNNAAPPPENPPAEAPPDPAQGAPQAPEEGAGETSVEADASAEAPVEGETVTEGGVVEEEPPPQTGFFGGGLWKKILIGVGLLFLIGILIFIFIPKQQEVKNVKLVWWGLWEDAQVMEPLISDFEKQNPNIQVEYVKQDPTQYRERLTARIKNGTGPDIFRYHNSWVPMLTDVLQPLSADAITADEFKKAYYPVMQKDLVINGGIYGIPLGVDTLAMFVNTELLDAAGINPPKNWDDFTKAAQKMTVVDPDDAKIKTAGAAIGTYGNIPHAPDIVAVLFAQQGVDFSKLEAAVPSETASLQFYTSFVTGDKPVWNGTLDDALVAFGKGEVALYFGYSWDIFRIQAINKELPFAIHPMPGLYGKNMSVASYWVEGVSAQSTNQKEAMLFMNYLSQKETAQKFYSATARARGVGVPPARRDLAASVQKTKFVAPFVNQLENVSSSFFASDTHDGDTGINFLLNNYLADAINGIINDGTSVETVVTTLNEGIAQVFEKYAIQ